MIYEKIEETYCEAFDGIVSRILVTARDEKYLELAIKGLTALPSTVVNRTEAGLEKYLYESETPDKRIGAIIQVWGNYSKDTSQFEYEYSLRIRQGCLVIPTTTLFNALESDRKIDIMERVGHCGDGYEWIENRLDREMINIPLMMGEWLGERYLGIAKGVAGGNFWIMCDSMESAIEAGEKALDAIHKVEDVVTPFDVCSAGSKVETNFPEIGPTTNHPYCPTLKGKIPDSKVPDGVTSIPEIVINGLTIDNVKDAMRTGIEACIDVPGVVKVSAGNYGGKLGKYKIYLRELFA